MPSKDMPANAAHAGAAPLQVVVEWDPLPRFAWRYSAVIDHGPFNPHSAPSCRGNEMKCRRRDAAARIGSRPQLCHSMPMTLLRFNLQPGQSIFDQVVFAAVKAFVSGEFQPGQAFPSVRALAADLKIHPNTAHKVVQYLIQERWLEARPGIGTVVAERPEVRASDRRRLLKQEVEQLVVEAKRVGVDLQDLIETIEAQWKALDQVLEAKRK